MLPQEEQHRRAAAADWAGGTACIEGAILLMKLRSPVAQCIMCAWFNEWNRFGERDQLSFAWRNMLKQLMLRASGQESHVV